MTWKKTLFQSRQWTTGHPPRSTRSRWLLQARSWLFKPLAKVLNDMAVRIEHLFNNNQITLHAMAHELRTPIARLRFALNFLDEAQTKEKYQQYRQDINVDIDELESLINVSLGLFRMQKDGVVLNQTPVQLREWASEVYQTVAQLKPEYFKLTYNIEDKTACFDSKIISIAVTNLLLNAFKYASSCVELSIYLKDEIIYIEVDDDGAGIPEDYKEKIFIPFSRLDNSRTRATGGFGLGLAYVKLIVELHHGSVYVSDSPLGGSRFTLTIHNAE